MATPAHTSGVVSSPSRLNIDERSRQALEARFRMNDDDVVGSADGRRAAPGQAIDNAGDGPSTTGAAEGAGKKRARKPDNPQRYDAAHDIRVGDGRRRARTGNENSLSSGSDASSSSAEGGAGTGVHGPTGFAAASYGSPAPPRTSSLSGSGVGDGGLDPTPHVAGILVPVGTAVGERVLNRLPQKAGGAPTSAGKQEGSAGLASAAHVVSTAPSPSRVSMGADGKGGAKKGGPPAQTSTLQSWIKKGSGPEEAASPGNQEVAASPPVHAGPPQPRVVASMPPPPPASTLSRGPEANPPPPSLPTPRHTGAQTVGAQAAVSTAPQPRGGAAGSAPSTAAAAAATSSSSESSARLRALEGQVSALTAEKGRLEEQRAIVTRERKEACERIVPMLIRLAKVEAAEKRRELAELQSRVGRWDKTRTRLCGTESKACEEEIAKLEDRLVRIEAQLTELRKRKTKLTKSTKAASGGGSGKGKKAKLDAVAEEDEDMEEDGGAGGDEGMDGTSSADIMRELQLQEEEERLKVAQAGAKRDLEADRARLVRMKAQASPGGYLEIEAKRQRQEDDSKFFLTLLGGRYLCVELLGEGGAGAVWKAVDVLSGRVVAVKLNLMDERWTDKKREHYVKHVMREMEIMQGLEKHDNVVELLKVLLIDGDSIAMVLEYCDGQPVDLDRYLAGCPGKCLPEKEARAILLQILAALRHINHIGPRVGGDGGAASSGGGGGGKGGGGGGGAGGVGGGGSSSASPRRIIHYDLKPANVLFDAHGTVKVADFGVSKIMQSNPGEEEGDATSMELTSQGAGTAWYLPPECYRQDPRISNKVDVYSTGVLFFQMLYGRRPFGPNTSQEEFSRQANMTGVHGWSKLVFPPERKVTDAAKEFMRRALTLEVDERPDVESLCCDPYLRLKLKQ